MKLGHLGHLILTGLATATGIAAEMFAGPAGPLVHLAWAPAALMVAKWAHFAVTKAADDASH
jgi:hypothetical protein